MNFTKLILLTFFTIFLCKDVIGQKISVKSSDSGLNEVLLQIRNEYGLKLSFDDEKLSEYKITVEKEFASPVEAFDYLTKTFPVGYEKNGEVYVFFPKTNQDIPQNYLIAGQVLDYKSFEALPFSHVIINGFGTTTDFKGNFSYISTDSIFRLKASYLGYYVLDTVVRAGRGNEFPLIPSNINLEEIIVEGKNIARSIKIGTSPGTIKLNHKTANFLPGSGDNSVFNLLRLQPGILAAGEQANDLIIWGSYEGQSQVLFDGYTIYGLKNFNDNISAVNPLMAKDLKIMKGGFGAEYGDRVGGIVDISGIEGSKEKPEVKLNINNMTLNGMVSVPMFEASSLAVAYRQTYYDLYDKDDFLKSTKNDRGSKGRADIYLDPEYRFHDLNLKFSGQTQSGDSYYLSVFGASDEFLYQLTDEKQRFKIESEHKEKNNQRAGALYYGKKWQNGNATNLTVSHSFLEKQLADKVEIEHVSQNQNNESDIFRSNQINNSNMQIDHRFALKKRHAFEFGVLGIQDKITMTQDSMSVNIDDRTKKLNRLSAYVQDKYYLSKKFQLQYGMRFDYAMDIQRTFLQPRILAYYSLTPNIKFNTAWGIYNQFAVPITTLDDIGNIINHWAIADDKGASVLDSEHLTAGFTYTNDDFTFSVEAYRKKTDNVIRRIKSRTVNMMLKGKNKSYGVDFYLKGDYGKHTGWIAYSLGRTEEKFDRFRQDDYRRALHDQTHEVKGAVLLNFSPFYFSANYVYGSGFPNPSLSDDFKSFSDYYSRFDVAAIYKYTKKKYYVELGVSVLNLFDRENVRTQNIIRINANKTTPINVHAEAVPFTPTIFLNLAF